MKTNKVRPSGRSGFFFMEVILSLFIFMIVAASFTKGLAMLWRNTSFVKEELTDHERFAKDEGRAFCATWMGVVKLPGHDTGRRLDIKIYQEACYAFALVYFTGDGDFNRGMRNIAHKYEPPLSLNDHGLYPVDKCKMAGGVETGPSLKCHSEEELFHRMGLVYKEPSQRLGVTAVEPLPGCGPGWRWADAEQNFDYKEADWSCPICNALVFAKKEECYRCAKNGVKTTKPTR